MRLLLPLAVFGFLTQASLVARAQTVDPATATPPENAEPEAATAPPDPEKALFERGSRDYDEGRFDEAAAAFEEAHRLYGKPGYLFNLAQVRRMQKACGPALSAYNRYLAEAAPDDQRRTLALRHQAEMQRCAQPPVTTPPTQIETRRTATPPAPRAATANGPRWLRPAGIAAVSVGAASAVAAALFQWHAKHISNQINQPGARFTQERVDQGRRSQKIAIGLLIGAVVAGSTGTTFLLVSPAAAPSDTGAARGPVLVYAGEF